jgi:hypothetical protein
MKKYLRKLCGTPHPVLRTTLSRWERDFPQMKEAAGRQPLVT